MNLYIILAFIAIYGLTISQAAVVRPQTYHQRADKKPWELIEAIRATSQIRGFNGTWITGGCQFKTIILFGLETFFLSIIIKMSFKKLKFKNKLITF